MIANKHLNFAAREAFSLSSFGGEGGGEEAVTPGSGLASFAIALVPLSPALSPALSPRFAGGEREKPVGRRGLVWNFAARERGGQFFRIRRRK